MPVPTPPKKKLKPLQWPQMLTVSSPGFLKVIKPWSASVVFGFRVESASASPSLELS